MTKVNDGGPAMPTQWEQDGILVCHPGLTKRDYFAGQALVGMLGDRKYRRQKMDWAKGQPEVANADDSDAYDRVRTTVYQVAALQFSREAYAMADAMLKARGEDATT